MPFALERDESLSDGLRRIADEQLAGAIEELESPGDRDLRRVVHGVRKRGKRVRAVSRLARPALGKEYRRVNAAVRDAARHLAPIRDAHALLATFDALVAGAGDDRPDDGLVDVRAGLARRAQAATEAVGSGSDVVAEAVNLFSAARDRIQLWPPVDGFGPVARGLGSTYRRGRDGFREAGHNPSPEAYHEWRKGTKYLWHQTQVLAPSAPSILRPLADALHDLADALGDDHDLAVLIDTLQADIDAFGGDIEVKAAVHLADQRQADLEWRALLLGARLYAEKEKAFVSRIERYWKAWKEEGDELATGEIATLVPADDALVGLTRVELYRLAQAADLPGRSTMTRTDLLGSLRALGR